MNWLLDGVIIALLAGFIIYFCVVGFAKSLFSLLSGIIAIVLAFSFCNPLAKVISDKWIYSAVDSFVGNIITDEEFDNKSIDEMIDSAFEQWGPALSVIGITSDSLKEMCDDATSDINDKKAELKEKATESVSDGISKVIAFIVIFIVSLILLKLLSLIFEKLFELPVLKQLNHIFGAVIGAVLGIIAVLLMMTVFKLIMPSIKDDSGNQIITEEVIEDTIVFKIIYRFKL